MNEFEDGNLDSEFYESSGEAFQKDVVPRSRGIAPKPDLGTATPNLGAPAKPQAGRKISFDELRSRLGGEVSVEPEPQSKPSAPAPGKVSFEQLRARLDPDYEQEPAAQPAPAPKEPGLDLGNAIAKGWKTAMVTWDVLANKLEKLVTGEEKDTKDILAKSAAELAKMESDPRIAEMVRLGDKAETTPEAVRDVLWFAVRNPTMILNFAAEQVTGAAVGGGIGGVITAPLRAMATGAATKMGASQAVSSFVGKGVQGAAISSGAVVSQSLGSNYVEGLNKFKGDTEAASEYAVTKTMAEVPANAVSGFFLGLAPFGSKIANTVGVQGTIQGTGGVVGAYQAAKAVGEEASRGELILEFLGEFAFAPAEVLISKFGDKKKTDEQNRADILDRLGDDAGRQEIWRTLNGDPKIAQVLKDVGLESPNDPNFDDAVQKVMDAVRVKEAVEKISPPSDEEIARQTKVRQADANAAFRDTASTGVGVGMGTPVEGVIRRDSITVDEENRELIPKGDKPEEVMLPQEDGVSTPAVSGEDIVARQQGFSPLPGMTIGTTPISNRFVTEQQAISTVNRLLLGNELETKLEAQREFGGVFQDAKALEKAQRQLNALRGQFGAPVIEDFGVKIEPVFPDFADQQLAIRRGQRSRDAGGGSFYFVEARKVGVGPQQVRPERVNVGKPPKPVEGAGQPQAGQGIPNPAAPPVAPPAEPGQAPQPAPPAGPAQPAGPQDAPLKKAYKFGEQIGGLMAVQVGGKPAIAKVVANLPPKGFQNIYKTPGALVDIEITGEGVPNGKALTKGVRIDGELTAESLRSFVEKFANPDANKPDANAGKAPDPKAPFNPKEFEKDLRGAKTLAQLSTAVNAMLRRGGSNETFNARRVPYEEAAKRVDGFEQIVRLARIFNKPVLFLEALPGSADFFGGAVMRGDRTIFVNVKKGRAAHLRVFGHEFLHALRNTNPDAYAKLKRLVEPEIEREAFKRYSAWLKRVTPSGIDMDTIREEVIADVVGDRFGEAKFWEMVAERNPSVFQEIAQAVIKFIDDVLGKLADRGGDLNSQRLVKDLESVRKSVADIVAQYGPNGRGEAVRTGGGVAFAAESKTRKGDTVSTRLPTGVTATENPIKKLLTIGIDAIRQTPGMLEQHAEVISKYPNLTEKQATGDAESVIKAFVDHVVENLIWLHNKMPAEIRARAKLWYDGANKIAKDFSKEFDLTTAQAAGVLATQSPQKDWFQNVDLARRIGTIYRNQQNFGWTEEMSKKADEKVFLKKTEKKEAILKAIRGKSLSELNSPILKGAWIRVYDETYNSPSHRIVTPEGDYAGTVMNSNGTETKVAWGSFSTIAKAISIIEDGSIENISEQLGSAHKVRSFYNNIADPKSKDGHVTIDTHAVAAALLRPLGGSATEVNHALGTSKPGVESPSESAIYGVSGNYGIYADAYRIAAQKLGILPRELQSITWEAVRGLFPETFKKGASAIKIDELWYAYKTGDRSKTDVRNETFKLAEGITQPDWVGVSASPIYEGERDTADAGELSGSGLPGRDTGVDSGTGGGTTAGTQAEVAEQTPPEGGVSVSRAEVALSIAGQENSGTTQVATTSGSYKKAASAILEAAPDAASVLDYGAGLGIGTDAMREVFGDGVTVESYEPFPQRWAGSAPVDHTQSDAITEKYDAVVNLNVLNVLEPKLRDQVVRDIADKLAPGGVAIIGTRKWTGDIATAKNVEKAAEEKAVYVVRRAGGKDVRVYQKGFDGRELVDYLSGVLGDGFTVSQGSGIAANTAIIKREAVDQGVTLSISGGIGNAIANANVPGTFAGAVRDRLASALLPTGDQRFNWWHKSVGTQLEKARTNPYYRKVYDLGQKFLDDVAMFAMRAQAAAPSILPNLGQFGLKFWKGGISKANNELIGRILAEGTLYGGPNPNTGKVWTDAELRSQYNATDEQIKLYREARAAIDQSLDDTAKAQMGQIARTVGVQQAAINPMMEEQVSMIVVRDRLVKLLGSLPQTEAVRAATKNVQKVALDVNMLKKGGYAPLMRFGEFVVSVENAKGEVEYFSMHETAAEALRVRNGVMKQFTGPGYKVSNPGARLNSARFKMFAGLSPSTLEAFFNAVPLTSAAEENLRQEYLQLAVATRSALSRMIKRKGTAGYSIDATRTLAAFITSNARHASKALNSATLSKAITEIPPEQGDVANEAVKLAEYVQHPVEGVPALRGFLFFNFLGGSVAAGLVNLSQPVMMTHPYLSQWGARRATAAMTQALKDTSAHLLKKPTGDKTLDAALKLAAERGITQPQEMFQLMAAAESGASTLLGHKFMRIWGLNFAVTEVFNRTVTFSAAFNVGRNLSAKELADAGSKDAFEFAVKAVEDTQGKYNKGNRPNWARETGALGTIGTLAFTFKQFSIAYLEFLKQLYKNKKGGKKALGLALGMLILAAGISGLPGADDLDDLIDTTGNWLGYPTNSKKWKVKFLRETLGLSPDVANFVLYGASYFMPVDLQARLGLANLIPGTGLLNPTKDNKAKEVLDVLGPLGGFAANAAEAVEFAAKGNLRGAGLKIAPKAVKDAYMGFEMASTGEFKDERGRLVQKVDNVDALVRATGFNPQDLASQSRVERMIKADIDIVKKKKEELHEKLARAIVDKDPKLRQEALDELRRWNSRDPEYRLKIDMDVVRNRVKNMIIERSKRFAKTAPKEMRARVMRELREEKAARN